MRQSLKCADKHFQEDRRIKLEEEKRRKQEEAERKKAAAQAAMAGGRNFVVDKEKGGDSTIDKVKDYWHFILHQMALLFSLTYLIFNIQLEKRLYPSIWLFFEYTLHVIFSVLF
jgi:hypothetical protein